MQLFRDDKMKPFWFLTLAFVLGFVVSQLIQDGAFMDGMLYASVSKNLADGIGTFWDPHFCKTYQSSFHEQPPLYFGLLALFYKIFGSGMYVERLFSFTCLSVTALYIHKLWKKIVGKFESGASFSWLPILFWISMPVCAWAYINFVEEVVMSMFVIISVYYIFKGLFLQEKIVMNLVIAGVFIFLSTLTKGIQGAFPIIAAGAYWLVTKKISFQKMLVYSVILVGIPAFIYGALILFDHNVYVSFEKYFQNRIMATFANKGATTENRLDIMFQLFMNILPAILLCLVIYFISKRYTNIKKENNYTQVSRWFILLGLSGSLPLIVTLEQRTFYLVTCLPFFAIAMAIYFLPYFSILFDRITLRQTKIFKGITFVMLTGAIIFCASCIGKTKRHETLLHDVYLFGKIIPRGETIGIPVDMCFDFSFKEYLIRYYYVSCDDTGNKLHFFANRKNLPKNLVPPHYKLYPLETEEIDLYVLDTALKNN